MTKIRKNQKKLYIISKSLIIITAIFLIVFIGIKPIIDDYSAKLSVSLSYAGDLLVIVSLIFLFIYYSRYGKIDALLTGIENEINDSGFYISSRECKDNDEYINIMSEDLKSCGYSVNKNIEVNELDFDVKAVKKREIFYIINTDELDRNDILAYLDTVIYDITAINLKRSASIVLCFVTDKACDDAIALSKMITPIGKKARIKIALAIAEVSTSRVYFLGNQPTKQCRMIANFVMNCDIPIKDKYISKERLPYQQELEYKAESLDLKDFRNENFFVH